MNKTERHMCRNTMRTYRVTSYPIGKMYLSVWKCSLMQIVPKFRTVMMPTFKGNIGCWFLSRGTTGMLKLFVVTVCAFSLLGFVCLCISDGRPGPPIPLDGRRVICI